MQVLVNQLLQSDGMSVETDVMLYDKMSLMSYKQKRCRGFWQRFSYLLENLMHFIRHAKLKTAYFPEIERVYSTLLVLLEGAMIAVTESHRESSQHSHNQSPL